MKLTIEFPAFHKPFGASPMHADINRRTERYGCTINRDDGNNAGLGLPWKPNVSGSVFRFTFRSQFAPVITLADPTMYATYKKWCDVCDCRQLGRDIMFRGATVELVIADRTAVREVIVHDLDGLTNPINWQPSR